MKNLIHALKKYAKTYMDFQGQPRDNQLIFHKLSQTIQEAHEKHLALHAIYEEKSFTGDLVKWDTAHNKLILKNIKHNISAIIPIDAIKNLTLVPPTVRQSQENHNQEKRTTSL